jgi:putative hemolysin
VERVFELGDRKVNSLFTHRSQIVFIDTTDSWEIVKSKINEEKHSAYPVCENNDLDDIIGVVLLKDLFTPTTDDNFDIKNFIKKPVFLNESSYAYKVLEIFKKERMHYGIVVDEYGSTIGMVTMDDVVDALVGDVTENDQYEFQITQRDENSWLVDGQYSIIEFLKHFDLNIDVSQQYKFATIAGLLIYTKNSLPNVGDKFEFDDYEIEIVDKDGQRIDKIMVTKKGR